LTGLEGGESHVTKATAVASQPINEGRQSLGAPR